jgi:DNA-binding MarR family transcriptional regulator
MSTLLQREIQQRRPFAEVGELVFLNLVRTTEALARGEIELLKARDLSFAQYNVLRILRGAGDADLSCGEISERMVKRDPDVTRLLDRLVARGLATRDRHADDRRVVISRITEQGRSLLDELDEPLAALHREQTAHMGPDDLHRLVGLLERLRTPG